MTQVLCDQAKSENEKKRYQLTALSLREGIHLRFRANFEHGILGECFIPLGFHYVLGTFNEDWAPCQNLLLVHLVLILGYFRFQTTITSVWPFWLLAYAYMTWEYWQ